MSRPSNHVAPQGVRATLRHYIGDFVYGANDGLVTTFAAVAGVEGGSLSALTILIVGVANLAADGLSMGIGNYLSIRARESARAAEGLPEEESQPIRHGTATALAFMTAGAVPLLPYALGAPSPSRGYESSALTFATLFAVGAARGVITGVRWWWTGLEVLMLGAAAGAVAYLAGMFIANAVNG
jgi:VIT1/CCC1 family predicted Fe2+/Mn2+ transporter